MSTLNTRKIIRGKGTEREDGPSTGASPNISRNHFYVSHVPLTDTAYRPDHSTGHGVTSASKVRCGLEICLNAMGVITVRKTNTVLIGRESKSTYIKNLHRHQHGECANDNLDVRT